MTTLKRRAGIAKIHELDSSSDQEYKPQPRSKAKTITTIASKKRKRGPATLPGNKSINDYIIVTGSSATAKVLTAKDWRHPVSQHVITNPLPMREALLRWYAQVHETRGMPWRKPYNDELSLEERSQRAYEVCISAVSGKITCADFPERSGSQRSCYNKRRW
jgi:A/G-specific adenine glycosylase